MLSNNNNDEDALPAIYYGTVGRVANIDAFVDDKDDDEELKKTPADVIKILGFDPLSLKIAQDAKLKRDVFLYMEPKRAIADFAQCSSCVQFMPTEKLCSIFDEKVSPNAACGLYIHGEPSDDQKPKALVTKEVAGYVDEKVRCENCVHGENGKCGFFKQMNEDEPDLYDLDININPKGCCNAFQPKV